MRTLSAVLASAALVSTATVAPLRAAETATSTVAVNVQVASRTSLKVSSDILQFDVPQPGVPATAAIDFSAGARIAAAAHIVLTVEPLRGLDGPGGAADVEASITFDGDGDGLLRGTLDAEAPAIAGRWQGSGLHQGRLLFTIRANAAGTYTLPVRFVLSTP
jgi:hypothetical protein